MSSLFNFRPWESTQKSSNLGPGLVLAFALLFVMLGFSICKADKQTVLPTPDPKYADPLADPVYEKAVMESQPEFTEEELLKAISDVQPVINTGSRRKILDHMTNAGWERNRAYYVVAKICASVFILRDDDRERIRKEKPQTMPTDRELGLVRKNFDAVRKQLGVKRRVYDKAVMENKPEFTEAELRKAIVDLQAAPRGNGRDAILEHMAQNAGWEINRADYVLSKIETAELILSNPNGREIVSHEFPQAMPTDKELDLVRKNLAAVRKILWSEE